MRVFAEALTTAPLATDANDLSLPPISLADPSPGIGAAPHFSARGELRITITEKDER